MQQQIKVITIPQNSNWQPGCQHTEDSINAAWEAATSPEGVRPAVEAVYPLGNGFVLLVFSGDLARATVDGAYASGWGDGRQELRKEQEVSRAS